MDAGRMVESGLEWHHPPPSFVTMIVNRARLRTLRNVPVFLVRHRVGLLLVFI